MWKGEEAYKDAMVDAAPFSTLDRSPLLFSFFDGFLSLCMTFSWPSSRFVRVEQD